MHRILLIDDVQLVLQIEKGWLEERRMEVAVARTAEAAFPLIQEFRPDLVVIDYEMPGMNGAELCQYIRADPKRSSLPVVIVSAHTDDATVQKCLAAGAAAFVSKSRGRDELLNNIANVLGLPHRRHMRLKCSIKVGVKAGSTRNETGMIRDISLGGALLVSGSALAVGTKIEVRFSIPHQKREIVASAEVVRRADSKDEGHACGVQFTDVDAESRRLIQQFVENSI